MADVDWATETHPAELLRAVRGRVSHRKLRLLACACCRRHWAETAPAGRHQIELTERYADGLGTTARFLAAFPTGGNRRTGDPSARAIMRSATYALGWPDGEQPNSQFDYSTGDIIDVPWGPGEYIEHFTNRVMLQAAHAAARRSDDTVFRTAMDHESAAQADLVRCIIPDPSRPVTFVPDWRTDTAVALARQMYDARDFALLPVLADALDDAGCDAADLLAHCRTPGPHARGCRAVDAVLGLS